jgi:hypothetical protein
LVAGLKADAVKAELNESEVISAAELQAEVRWLRETVRTAKPGRDNLLLLTHNTLSTMAFADDVRAAGVASNGWPTPGDILVFKPNAARYEMLGIIPISAWSQ